MSRTITLENGQKITISEESYKELSEATKVIKVPDNIKLIQEGYKRGHSIVFGKNQALSYVEKQNTWCVMTFDAYRPSECELVRVKPKDRVPGRVYYVSHRETPVNLEDIDEYKLYLGDEKSVYAWGGGVRTGDVCSGANWWEVRTL